jgi:hypothetical protein
MVKMVAPVLRVLKEWREGWVLSGQRRFFFGASPPSFLREPITSGVIGFIVIRLVHRVLLEKQGELASSDTLVE